MSYLNCRVELRRIITLYSSAFKVVEERKVAFNTVLAVLTSHYYSNGHVQEFLKLSIGAELQAIKDAAEAALVEPHQSMPTLSLTLVDYK